MSKTYPSFEEQFGRKPVAGQVYNPDKGLCQDDFEFLTGTGCYEKKPVEQSYTGADCLAFPVIVPGYGQIVNHSAWQVFLSDYRSRCEALERITRYCQMQEVEKEMEE